MYIFELIAERRIKEAMEKGEFDNLSCAGKPLPPDGLEYIPEDLRTSFKILKNSGYVPEEVDLRKSIYNLNQLLDSCTDEKQKNELRQKLNEKQFRYSTLVESRNPSGINLMYHEKILNRLK